MAYRRIPTLRNDRALRKHFNLARNRSHDLISDKQNHSVHHRESRSSISPTAQDRPPRHPRLWLRISQSSLCISIKQLLTIRLSWRPKSVRDRCQSRSDELQPEERRPAQAGNQKSDFLGGGDERSGVPQIRDVGRAKRTSEVKSDTADASGHEDHVDNSVMVKESNSQSAKKWCAITCRTLLKIARDTTRCFEARSCASESFWQNERAHECDEVVWRSQH